MQGLRESLPCESAFNRRVKSFTLDYKESHLKVFCDKKLKEKALEKTIELYGSLEKFIQKNPMFLISYTPVKVSKTAPRIVRYMAQASKKVGVGPMAAVAGALAEGVGTHLLKEGAGEVVVENGGDIFLKLKKERLVGVHAGSSVWSNKLAFKVKPKETPLGICTSSATVGPSINLGKADAITVVAKSAALADAAATAIGNKVKGEKGLEKAMEVGKKIKGVKGFLIIRGDKLAIAGRIPELVKKRFEVKR